ncbi:MAG: GAF domain-containing protein [Cyclobacteriaceae bacterium]|nr:GAF domain-containing protein [Cyclobacteriaceae bacterium]
MNQTITLSREEKRNAFREINESSDRIMKYTLFGYFAFGLFLATFYDTYFIAILSGGLCLAAYFVPKILLPQSALYRYVMAVVVGVFSAQYIYQMHGMFEMHFFFFVASALLITYQNWKLQIPLLLFVVIHHATFALIQYSGMKEIYFTQLDYMDLQTFIFHAGIAGVIIFICGYWAFDLERKTIREYGTLSELGKQLSNVGNNIQFAEEIAKGNLQASAEVAAEDELGKSLMRMRTNLVEASERERAEKYITGGIAHIGEILRRNNNDIKALSDELISSIVKYLGANQGALFLLEEEESSRYLNMTACYAYERKKFMESKVDIGQGLIGQCFLEREIIYMTNVPDNYVRITSGLGTANPKSIVLVPLITNEEVYGVLELASFQVFTEMHLSFLRKASESIASSIVSTRTTEKIKGLLEESQQRSEELRAQEEEMRQNMEEMQATQEEMGRKNLEVEKSSAEFKSILKGIDESMATIEFAPDGTVLTANENFLKTMKYALAEITGSHHNKFVPQEIQDSEEYRTFWKKLAAGHSNRGIFKRLDARGGTVWLNAIYSPILDPRGQVIRVVKFATDITELKKSS